MLDFRSPRKSKRPYGPEGARWLWGLLFLGLVVIVAWQWREPENWRFLLQALMGGGPGSEPPIDNRLTFRGKEDPAGEVVFVLVEEGAPAEAVPIQWRQEPIFSPEDLEKIQDDSPPRRVEMELWRRLLQILHQTPQAELEKRSEGVVSYGQLFRQSSVYRGRLVTVRGRLRRAQQVPMPGNPWGQRSYYQAWLQPIDQPACPMQVFCLELPEGFPLGLRIDEQVEITGFYFKRTAYQAQDGLRTTPTLVARTFRWFPQKEFTGQAESLSGVALVGLLVAVALLGIATAVGMYWRVPSNRRFEVPRVPDFPEGEPLRETSSASPPDQLPS